MRVIATFIVFLFLALSGFSQAALVAEYKFDGQVNQTQVQDDSGNGHVGTIRNDARVYSNSHNCEGLYLPQGNTSHPQYYSVMTVDNSPDLQITGNLTLMAWIYVIEFPADGAGIITKNYDRNNPGQGEHLNEFWFAVRKNGLLAFGDNGLGSSVNANANIQTGRWYHVAVVRDMVNHELRFFVDGTKISTVSYNKTPYATNYDISIGACDPCWYPFKGYIDEVKIYNNALSDQEIADIYNCEKTGSCDCSSSSGGGGGGGGGNTEPVCNYFTVSVTSDKDTYQVGEEVQFRVEIDNSGYEGEDSNGDGTKDYFSFDFYFPTDNLDVVDYDQGWPWSCSNEGDHIHCCRNDYDFGGTYVYLKFKAKAAGTATGEVKNFKVKGDYCDTGTDCPANTASKSILIQSPPQADLSISKSDEPDPVTAGTQLTYTLTIQNSGPDEASNVVVTDTLPEEVTFLSAEGDGWSCDYDSDSRKVTCKRNSLSANSTSTITIKVSVDPGASGSIENTASIKSDTEDPDSNSNSVSESTTVNQSADISVSKSVDNSQVDVGDEVTFEVLVKNDGPSDATGLEVTDKLPEGFEFKSYSASQGTYDSSTGVWDIGSLSEGSTATLSIVAAAKKVGTYTNTAELTSSDQSDPDSVPNNHDSSEDDQSSVSVVVNCVLRGHVYEDVNGDGDLSDKQAVGGVTLKLFDSNGNPISSTTTDSNGNYKFSVASSGDYYIVVDSKTVSPSAGYNSNYSEGDVWAEQTYVATSSNGDSYSKALCDRDSGSSTPPEEVSGSGPCYGGAYGDRSDDASSLDTAEHKIKVHLDNSSCSLSNLDFGFSFNVVTNVNDQDDDENNNRTAQGSLRQFIQNANAISGANYMRFVPAVKANSHNWWTVVLNITADSNNLYALPPITDSNTTIDGTAYSYQDGKSVRNTNSGSVSAPGSAGTQAYSIPPFDKPELEVNADNRGSAFTVKASSVSVKRVAVYNVPTNTDKYPACVFVDSGSDILIEDNYLGVRADGAMPSSSERAFEGVVINSHARVDVKHNLIAYIDDTGITQNGEGTIEENYIHHTGLSNSCGDSITFEFMVGPSYTRTKDQVVVKNNYIENSAAYGIESWGDDGGYTISNNTITKSGRGSEDGGLCGDGNLGTTELGGIRLFGDGSLVEYNKIFDNPGSGIVLVAIDDSTPSKRNKITKNSFYSNGGISIDLDQTHREGTGGSVNPNGDGVTPNDGVKNSNQQNEGLDYPVFTSVSLNGSTLHVEGYVGTPDRHIEEVLTIEVYKADDDGNNNGEVFEGDGKSVSHGEGRVYIGSCTTNGDGTFNCEISSSGLSVGDEITAITIDSSGNTSEFSANYKVSSPNKITGYVYEDSNHDRVRAAGETGISNVRVELWYYDGSDWTMEASTQTGDDGYFEFTPSHTGTYRVIEDYNNSAGDNPEEGSDPDGYISTTPNVREISWDNSKNVIVDFGDFHGAKVSGRVFNDIGKGYATSDEANNGIYDSTEKGIQNVKVKLCKDSACSEPVSEALTAGDGTFQIWIPADEVSDGQELYLVESDLSGYTSTGDSIGSTVVHDWRSSLRERNTLTLTMEVGREFKDYNFGDVKVVQIAPPQSYLVSSGDSITIKHRVNVSTPGTVALMLASKEGWDYSVYNDSNCDGEPEGAPVSPSDGYYVLNDGKPVGVGDYCVVMKTVVPTSTPDGTVEKLDLFVYEDWKNTSGNNGETGSIYDDSNSVSDTIKVSSSNSGMLKLEKWVRNVTIRQGFTKSNTARPCEVLEYRIDFKNVGSTPVKLIVLSDNIPDGTHFLTSRYDEGRADVQVEVDGNYFYGKVSDNPDTDGVVFDGHTLKVDLNKLTGGQYEELLPGVEGWLRYQVRLDGNCN